MLQYFAKILHNSINYFAESTRTDSLYRAIFRHAYNYRRSQSLLRLSSGLWICPFNSAKDRIVPFDENSADKPMLTPKYTDLSEGLYFNFDPFKANWFIIDLVPVYSCNFLTSQGVVLSVQITLRAHFIPPGSLMIHSTITWRITICISIFGREGSANIVWKRIYAWTCKFTYKPKIKKKQWVGYSVKDGWAFSTVSDVINLDSIWDTIPFFFGDRFWESLEVTNPMSRILLMRVSVFFNFCSRRVKVTRVGNKITVFQENQIRDKGYFYKTF